ncbi:hypothetical protein R6Z07F_004279 [Ovis aries]
MTNQYSILFKQEQAHDDAIWSGAWGSNKKENSETVVTASLDDLVKVWKWRDEKLDLQWSLEGHQLGVVSLDISHTLPIAASSSLDAHIHLWDLENGKQDTCAGCSVSNIKSSTCLLQDHNIISINYLHIRFDPEVF